MVKRSTRPDLRRRSYVEWRRMRGVYRVVDAWVRIACYVLGQRIGMRIDPRERGAVHVLEVRIRLCDGVDCVCRWPSCRDGDECVVLKLLYYFFVCDDHDDWNYCHQRYFHHDDDHDDHVLVPHSQRHPPQTSSKAADPSWDCDARRADRTTAN
eukprot:scaffold14574_cov38-Cyclotella_meneghiniana.AAC.6